MGKWQTIISEYADEDPGFALDEESFDLAQPHIMTAIGPILPSELGVTLHHEHIIAKPLDASDIDSDLLLDDVHASLAELEDFYAAGGRAIVDMTPVDCGRNIEAISWVAHRAPLHVIVVTGHHKARHAAAFVGGKTVDELATGMVRELQTGIAGNAVRAGVIKAGTSLHAVSPVEETVLRAAGRAHLITGAPISTHTERGTMAREQISILEAEGVDPRRVIVGHMDFCRDERSLGAILETGAFVSIDQVSKTKHRPDQERAVMVKTLVDSGHVDQVLLSSDLARRSALRAYGGGPGWVYLLERFTLLLMEAGLEAAIVRRLLVDNPARALTIRP